MRSNFLLLATGLFVANSALASPCKPRTSTSEAATTTSIASTTQPTTTAGKTSTEVPSETFTEADTTTTIATISSDTSTAGTSDTETTPTVVTTTTATSEAKLTTTAEATTTTFETESTTTIETTTTTSEAETMTTTEATATTSGVESTTTAPVATPTFTVVGGGGSVNGAPLKSDGQEGSLVLFHPSNVNLPPRTFILNPGTGRVQDADTGVFLCAYYGYSGSPSDPASISFCEDGSTGPNMLYQYLNCRVVNGNLACTAPKSQCISDGNGNIVGCLTVPDDDGNNQFYYQYSSDNGDYLYISSGSPSGYTSVDLIAQEA